MKNLIIIDADVDYATLYMTGSKPWRSVGIGFTSIEYFYLADDELAKQLTSTNLLFTTGNDITIIDILSKADARPFAAKASGVRSYARLDMEHNRGEDDDQVGRIQAMIRLADEEEGGVSNVYRFAHVRNNRREEVAYFDNDKKQAVDMSRVSEIRRIGRTGKNIDLLDGDGNVVASNPTRVHLFRMYGYWQTLDKNGSPGEVKLAAPSAEDIRNIKFDDPDEVVCWSQGGELDDLFQFLNFRKVTALVNKANSWRKTQSREVYRLDNIKYMNFGQDFPSFDTQEDAERYCLDFCKKVVVPQMRRANPNLRCMKYSRGGFRIAILLPTGMPEATVELFDQSLRFPPGREYDIFKIVRTTEKTTTTTGDGQKDALNESQLGFWRYILDNMY